MVGLKDVAPNSEKVTVRGITLTVSGLSFQTIAALFYRFPKLANMLTGDSGTEEFAALGEEVVGALIAAGCGELGDPESEAAGAGLALDDQASIMEVILRLTMPKGIGPFMDRLRRMGLVIDEKTGSKQATKSRKQQTS